MYSNNLKNRLFCENKSIYKYYKQQIHVRLDNNLYRPKMKPSLKGNKMAVNLYVSYLA